jgi:hypothetical protein
MFFRQRAAADATLSYFFGCAGAGLGVAVDVVAGDEAWVIDALVADLPPQPDGMARILAANLRCGAVEPAAA